MRIFFRRILIFVLVAALFFTNINISGVASGIGKESFYQMKNEQEVTRQIENSTMESLESTTTVPKETTQEKAEKGTTEQQEKAEEGTTNQKRETEEEITEKESESTKTEDKSQQGQERVTDLGSKEGGQTEKSEETNQEQSTTEESEDEEESVPVVQSTHPSTNHSVTMPDVTSHYFLLQKNSKKVGTVTGKNLLTVANAQAASKYIYETYPNGRQYNFTPRFNSNSSVSVGGGSGGEVSFTKVKNGTESEFGTLYPAVSKGRIASKVFNLQKTTVNPYAIYKDVGNWYDYNTKRTYKIDLKITVTGYKFPGAVIRKQLSNQDLKAPYVGFQKNKIGISVMGTDYVQTRLDFYYSGTTTPVSGLKGLIQFCDIDAQQGVDFGTGFEKVLMFQMQQSKLQYNATGLIAGSKGYVSSRTSEAFDSNDETTTAVGIFAGSTVNCRWTVAKCDQKDTGGDATYAVKSGYGIPADSSLADSTSYYWSNSTGLLAIRADVGIGLLPDEVKKVIYQGKINSKNSESTKKFLGLSDRKETFSYVLSAPVPSPSNVSTAKYTSFQFEDKVESLLNVKDVKVYADEAVNNNVQAGQMNYTDVSANFNITKTEGADHATTVKVAAKNAKLSMAAFYGHSYYVHIEVQMKSDEELHKINRSITDWYQGDNTVTDKVSDAGKCQGSVAVLNKGTLNVVSNQGGSVKKESNYVASKVGMTIKVKKTDQNSGQPIEGVTFGLFGGENASIDKDTPIDTAVTNKEGIAVFKTGTTYSFYQEKYGDGPYCVKEISIPALYKNVWKPSLNKEWTYKIPTLKSEVMFDISSNIPPEAQLENTNYQAGKNLIKVYKKSKDTGAYLSGAEFTLLQWSQSKNQYEELFDLEEDTDENKKPVYQNKQEFKNTLDNLGRYKIVEKKAPKGCVLTKQEWTFELSENTDNEENLIIFENLATGEKQKGSLVYENPLQKGKIIVQKEDDEGQPVGGAVFSVTAAQDIYAPWDVKDNGTPDFDAKPLVAKGEVVDQITTGKDGKGESSKALYIGKYIVEEIKGAWNHIKGDTIYEAELRYGLDSSKALISYYLKVNNLLMRPALAVSKLADKTTNEKQKEVAFDEKTGRYIEEKVTGRYKAGEFVDYTIRVTNIGNVSLYNIKVTDDMDCKGEFDGQTLSKYADMETATFVLPESGYFMTKNGDKVNAQMSSESNLLLTLHHLAVDDSIEVHVKVKLKEDVKDAWKLKNEVRVQAEYDDNGQEEGNADQPHLTEVPVKDLIDGEGNSLVVDWDYINVPGTPEEKVIKTADRTTGIQIENGEITAGSKVPGIYNAKEKVKFSIVVKNSGEAALKKITVKDVMSDELKAVSDMESAGFVFGDATVDKDGYYVLTTANGKKITAKVVDKTTLILCNTGENGSETDRLFTGDYITLNYHVNLLPGTANLYDLSNKVYINGWYFNGNEDEEVPGEEDKDIIEVPGIPEGRTAKLADKTTGAVLKEGRYDAGAKISGVYENGNEVTYKITVTNTGSANLYDLRLTDILSKELEEALEKDSVSFVEQVYTSKDNRKVRTKLEESQKLWMDFLAAGDAVDVYLKGKVRIDVGNLFALENIVNLTARYKKGDEKARKEQEEIGEEGSTEKNEETSKDDEEKKEEDKKDDQEGTKVPEKELEPLSEESKKAIEEAYEAIQKLTVEELQEESKEYAEIPVTELMQDEDYINIPGTPLAKIAKLADKTQGATLVKGRYEGQKEEGTYEYGDTVDYTVTLTNAGTADLYNLLVDDTLDKKLLSVLKPDSITITTGQVATKMGDIIQVKAAEEDKDTEKSLESTTKPSESRSVVLDHLKSGDSVAIHLKGIIQSGAKRDTALNNTVHLIAQYKTVNENGKTEETYVEDTPEMTDNDTIGIGVPDILAAKKADKTKNAILENGRYTGKKKYGTYKAGEEVQFILTVTNIGNGTANHVKVTEEPSAELKKYVQIKGFANKAGDVIRTKKGKELHIETAKKRELCLEKIEAEDAVELIYIGKVKKDIPSIKFLKNEVIITGQNKDGSKIPTTSKMSDYDKINLKEQETKNQNPNKTRETSTKGNGAKTGDNTPILMYSFLSATAILALSVLISYKNKKRKEK